VSDQVQSAGHLTPVLLFLYDPAVGRYTRRQASGLVETEDVEVSFRPDGGLARWLSEQDLPVYLPDAGEQLLAEKLSDEERQELGSLGLVLFLPLRGKSAGNTTGDRLRGWVALGPRPSGEPYSPNDLHLLAAVANQTAIALESIHLDESVKEINQAQSEFIDFVAHELKQPMTAMQGYAKMLTMGIGGQLTDTQQQFVEVIDSNVNRMGKLVNDLLEISRLEAGRTKLKLAPVRLKEIVEATIASTRTEIETRHHTLLVDTPDDLPPVLGDHERLVQILTNLVSNAYRYTPPGGVIHIAVNGQDHPSIPAGHQCVSVTDTGIGMSPQELAELGEKFFRSDHELVQQQPGNGLGVPISRGLVALHGGEFLIESEPGKGSTFRFTVPVVERNDE
jgi:signal transduction histidine kinase